MKHKTALICLIISALPFASTAEVFDTIDATSITADAIASGDLVYSNSLIGKNTFEWTGVRWFTSGGHYSGNQMTYLNFGDYPYLGWIEVSVTGIWNVGPTSGRLTKVFQITRPDLGGNLYDGPYYESQITSQLGLTPKRVTIGEFESVEGNMRVPIYFYPGQQRARGPLTITVRGRLGDMSWATTPEDIVSALSLDPGIPIPSDQVIGFEPQNQYLSGTLRVGGEARLADVNVSGVLLFDHAPGDIPMFGSN